MNTVVGILLMFAMVRSGSMSQATAIMFLVPAVAAIIAWPVAGETVPLIAVPGAEITVDCSFSLGTTHICLLA